MERDPRYSMKTRIKVGDPGLGASIIGGALIATVGLLIIKDGIVERQQKQKKQQKGG